VMGEWVGVWVEVGGKGTSGVYWAGYGLLEAAGATCGGCRIIDEGHGLCNVC